MMEAQSIEYLVQKFREQLCTILMLQFLPNYMSVLTPPSSKLYAELQQILSSTGCLIDMALPDGNCFFCSVSKELLGTQAHHATIITNSIYRVQWSSFFKDNRSLWTAISETL